MSNESIFEASLKGNLDRVKNLIERERKDVNSKDNVK